MLHSYPIMSSIILVFFSFKYSFIYIGTSLSIYKGALSHYKVHRGLYVGTFSMFLDLASCITLVSSFSIFVTFASY